MKEWVTDDRPQLAAVPPVALKATPFVIRSTDAIPRRQWLYGRHYVRGFVSATVAPSGLGKTSLSFAEAASMASGQALLGGPAPPPCRVWIINLEDPADELERRMAAILKHYRLDQDDIEDRLFIDSGRVMPIRLASKVRDTVVVAEPLVVALIREIRERRIDVVIVDPFVSSHSVPENDNGAIDRVAKTWARIADETDCSIELVHHIRKPAAGASVDFTVDDARGAVALIGAVRSARVLNPMCAEDAERAEIEPKDRRSYFRVDDGKSNMAPPVDKATWRRLIGVPLDNGTADEPGDWVGVVTPWELPGAFDGLSVASIRAVQVRIAAGKWAENVQASNWAGHAIADELEIDASSKGGKERVKTMLKIWIGNKILKIERQHSGRDGREKPMIVVGEWV